MLAVVLAFLLHDNRDNLQVYFVNNGTVAAEVVSVTLDARDVRELVKQKKVLWYDIVPNPVPSGEWCQVTIRFRGKAEVGEELRFGVLTKDGKRHEESVAVLKPKMKALSYCFDENLSRVHLWLRHATGVNKLLVGGVDVTKNTAVRLVPEGDAALCSVRLPRPLDEGKYAVVYAETEAGPFACVVRAMKPFFMIGMYRVQEDRPRFHAGPAREAWVKDCAAAGINTIAPDYICAGGNPEFLSKYGLKLVPWHPPRGVSVEKFARHPALLGWYLYDEPDLSRANPMSVVKHAWSLRQRDPKHRLIMTHWDGGLLAEFNFFDEAWFDFYPVTWLPLLREMLPYLRRCVEMLAPKPVRFVPQAFMGGAGLRKPGKAYGARFPTPAELRLMVYQCLGYGLKGVIYFAYSIHPREPVYGVGLTRFPNEVKDDKRINPKQVRQAQKLWDGMKRLNAELKTIGPLLMDGASLPLARCENKKVQVHAVLSASGKLVVFALNLDFMYGHDSFAVRPQRKVAITVSLPSWVEVSRAALLAGQDAEPLDVRVENSKARIVLSELRDASAIVFR